MLTLERLSAEDVSTFLVRECPKRSVTSARDLASALRSRRSCLIAAARGGVPGAVRADDATASGAGASVVGSRPQEYGAEHGGSAEQQEGNQHRRPESGDERGRGRFAGSVLLGGREDSC